MPELTQEVNDKPIKQFLERQRSMLYDARSSFDTQWKEISKFISPRRARFDVNDKDKGERKWNAIINNIATISLRAAVAGMFAGNMSPARPWFALAHPDEKLNDRDDVKIWLHDVDQKILATFRDSNFYSASPTTIKDLLLFGTSCMSHVDDQKDIARFYSHPIGSYLLGVDDRLEVVQMVREFSLYVDQVVSKFGLENVSDSVRTMYDSGNYKNHVYLVHFILPNPLVDPGNPFALGKPYLGLYYEAGQLRSHGGSVGSVGEGSISSFANNDQFLAVEGFNEKPFYAPRWTVEGEDTYATECPGMVALGDIKQLQSQEKRKGQAIDKQTNPPLQAPPTVKNIEGGVNALPGGVTFVETGGIDSGRGIRTLYDVNLNLQELRADMQEVERRVKDAFFVNLFLAITEMEGVQPRNEFELINRHDEALLQLGPVLQQLQGSFLSLVVDRIFAQLLRRDLLPEPPEAVIDASLEVRYISSLAQAQRAVGTQSLDRTLMFAGRANEVKPGTADKIDGDWMVEEYARVTGVSPKALVSDDEVAQKRQAEQQQQQALLQAQADREEAQAVAGVAKATEGG